MPSAKITSKGQVTIPKEVRAHLHLEPGDRLVFELREDGRVEVSPQNVDLRSLFGMVKPTVRGVTLEDMEEAIRAAPAGDAEG